MCSISRKYFGWFAKKWPRLISPMSRVILFFRFFRFSFLVVPKLDHLGPSKQHSGKSGRLCIAERRDLPWPAAMLPGVPQPPPTHAQHEGPSPPKDTLVMIPTDSPMMGLMASEESLQECLSRSVCAKVSAAVGRVEVRASIADDVQANDIKT